MSQQMLFVHMARMGSRNMMTKSPASVTKRTQWTHDWGLMYMHTT